MDVLDCLAHRITDTPQKLDDYELHMMADVILLHARLGAETMEREALAKHFSNHNH